MLLIEPFLQKFTLKFKGHILVQLVDKFKFYVLKKPWKQNMKTFFWFASHFRQ